MLLTCVTSFLSKRLHDSGLIVQVSKEKQLADCASKGFYFWLMSTRPLGIGLFVLRCLGCLGIVIVYFSW